MRRSLTTRLLPALALAGATSLGVLAFAGPASGVTGSASCKKIAVNLTSGIATLSSCSDTANTGGKGTIAIGALAPPGGIGVITWGTGHGTTTISIVVTSGEGTAVPAVDAPGPEPAAKMCPASRPTEFEAVGKVTADTGKAKSIKIGGKVSAEVCVGATIGLEPGTTFTV